MSDRVPNNSEMRYEKKSRQLPAQSVLTFNNRPTWTNNKNISDTFLPLLLYKWKHIWFRRAFIFCYDSNDVISIGLCPSVWEFHYSASALLLPSSTIAAAPGQTWTLSSVSPSKADNLLSIKAIYYDMLLADSYFQTKNIENEETLFGETSIYCSLVPAWMQFLPQQIMMLWGRLKTRNCVNFLPGCPLFQWSWFEKIQRGMKMKMHSTSFEHCSGSFLCGIQDAAECRSSCAPPVQQNIFP